MRTRCSRPSAASSAPTSHAWRAAPSTSTFPAFIQKIGQRDFRGAYDVITATNLLPAVCGRVCPQESQCEGVCTVGETLEPVAIGRLERWVGDLAIEEGWANIPHIDPRAIQDWHYRIGAGRHGVRGRHGQGRLRRHGLRGVPPARRRAAVRHSRFPAAERGHRRGDRQPRVKLGVKFECNTLVGRLFTIEQMLDEMGFDAVFVGTGAGYPAMLGIPGDSLNGVLSANELLTRCNLMRARDFPAYDTPLPLGRRVAVVGAGNTAMDAMRVCLRLGAERCRASTGAARPSARAR